MDYKVIDSKNKELYYNLPPMKESESILNARFEFWASMNNIAMQNMMLQQRKLIL